MCRDAELDYSREIPPRPRDKTRRGYSANNPAESFRRAIISREATREILKDPEISRQVSPARATVPLCTLYIPFFPASFTLGRRGEAGIFLSRSVAREKVRSIDQLSPELSTAISAIKREAGRPKPRRKKEKLECIKARPSFSSPVCVM